MVSKGNHESKPSKSCELGAVPWWFHFDPHPYTLYPGLFHLPILIPTYEAAEKKRGKSAASVSANQRRDVPFGLENRHVPSAMHPRYPKPTPATQPQNSPNLKPVKAHPLVVAFVQEKPKAEGVPYKKGANQQPKLSTN